MNIRRIAGINFDHMHMGDLLRQVHDHPEAEIVGICDEFPERMADAAGKFNIPPSRVFTDIDRCMKETKPDLVILCPATAQHAHFVERVAPYGTHILVEKPFAASLSEADRMIAAVSPGQELIINWPLRWYPSHITAQRLISEGRIGTVQQVHYYDGNRGPLRHGADKVESNLVEKSKSWFYSKTLGGGSLLDYLGYGTTLGTWFFGGRAPLDVTTILDHPPGLEVDEHSISVARYETGLSKYETRWGTFTDPWRHQPQPKCGFVIVGSEGTISSYDYEPAIFIQDRAHPEGFAQAVDTIQAPFHNPISYVIDRMEKGLPIDGPLSPATCRTGQRIVDACLRSASEHRTVALTECP